MHGKLNAALVEPLGVRFDIDDFVKGNICLNRSPLFKYRLVLNPHGLKAGGKVCLCDILQEEGGGRNCWSG